MSQSITTCISGQRTSLPHAFLLRMSEKLNIWTCQWSKKLHLQCRSFFKISFCGPSLFFSSHYVCLCTWTVYRPKQMPIQWESFLQHCVHNKHLLGSWWAHFQCECKSWMPLKYGCHRVKLYLFINSCTDGCDLTPNTHLSEDRLVKLSSS